MIFVYDEDARRCLAAMAGSGAVQPSDSAIRRSLVEIEQRASLLV